MSLSLQKTQISRNFS